MPSPFRASCFFALIATPALAVAGGETTQLLPSDNAPFDLFGNSVACDGRTAIVGAPGGDGRSINSGVAYLFDAATGQRLAKLLAVDGAESDALGWSVAIDGDTAIAGAYAADPFGIGSGAAYLFDVSTGQQLAKLLATDGAPTDHLGWSVAIGGSIAIAGAPDDGDNGPGSGSAYLFDVATGHQLAKLLPADGVMGASFGQCVAISGTRALIGVPEDDDHGRGSGSAYLFETTTGQQLAKLLPDDGAKDDWFGFSVAIHGDLAVIGAPRDDVHGEWSGSAYLFDVTTGQQLARLTPDGAAAGDQFGYAVAVDGARVVVGAVPDGIGVEPGSAYLFDVATGQQIASFLPSDSAMDDRFGESIALNGARALMGASGQQDHGLYSGSAYLFDTTLGTAIRYCFGNGCPCGNDDPTAGCANGAFGRGSFLSASGQPSASEDTLVLHAAHSTPGETGLFFQGDDAVGGGSGISFGDGLRCAGGSVLRLELVVADGTGVASSTIPIAATAGVRAGDVRRYQWWYRDPTGSPCGTGFNLSNGLEVTWGL